MQTLLGTPELFRAAPSAKFQQLKTDADPVPLADARDSAAPIAWWFAFRPTARADAPALKVQLLNRSGSAMSALTPAAAPKEGEQQVDLPLAGLRPASTCSKSRRSTATRQSSIGFRVVG